MQISQRGLDLIKRYEGFSAKAYRLPGEQFYTIGYGDYGAHVGKHDVISRQEAERRLRKRINHEFAPAVERLVTTHINQNRFDALVSFTYNVGIGALAGSTLLRLVNQRKFIRAAREFTKWNRGAQGPLPGLTKRRKSERWLFLRPVIRRKKR